MTDGMTDSTGIERQLAEARVFDSWFLTGPTASGKSHVGLELARRIGAEIVSLDSMAIYRGMDIGTAKPSAADRAAVPHHLLDLREPNEEFNVTQYLLAAIEAISSIRSRGKEALFVGGTPLYLKALLRGVFEGPPADEEFRREVAREAAEVGIAALHQRLALVDPISAGKLHPNDQRRIIRALEVYKLTGKPISHLQLQFDDAPPSQAKKVFQLAWPRAELHKRIDARVEAMFAAGLVDEVRGLLSRHGALSKTASQAVGYREVIAHLADSQSLALPTTMENAKARTRQFARRQETWFRSLPECRRIEVSSDDDLASAAERIVAEAQGDRSESR